MYRIIVRGVVQGVGFRPFIYREAAKRGIFGRVKNTSEGVEIIATDKSIVEALKNPPPLARIDSYDVKEVPDIEYAKFKVEASESGEGRTLVSPDIATCEECAEEMRSRSDRRYKHPFITCTNCGPRFSVIEGLPYDRANTSMRKFEMCQSCQKEYEEPEDRRFHAETIACNQCGPKLVFKDRAGNTLGGLREAAKKIQDGEVVAVKGIGGFHLMCKTDDMTVLKLRLLTQRHSKPFAVMARDMAMAEELAFINKTERELLESPARPILVLEKKDRDALAKVSYLDTIGVILPYSPVHHLLFEEIDEPLVDTSANQPGAPTSTEEEFGDWFLTNDRPIVNRTDDSVIRAIAGKALFLRRSRGYAPLPMPLEGDGIIALGGERNNTVTIVKDGQAFVSQYIGNTALPMTLDYHKETVSKMIEITGVEPRVVVTDMHPGYNTSAYGRELAKKLGVKHVEVQHHAAHAASVTAEHGLKKNVVAMVCDGIGYGLKGEAWGGEVFKDYKRVACLEEQPMVGGDAASLFPRKMLFGVLSKFMKPAEIEKLGIYREREVDVLSKMTAQKFNLVQTTSTGRVLDAASAFLGLCEKRTYQGEPAVLLESASRGTPYRLKPVILKAGSLRVLETTPIFEFLVENRQKPAPRLAATVHQYMAEGLLALGRKFGRRLVLSGGVAYNNIITSFLVRNGVLVNESVPAGDGGISFGQAAYFARAV